MTGVQTCALPIYQKKSNPRVVRLAAVFAIIVSFCPKFAAVVAAMPAAVIGGVSLVLYGMISSVGIRNLVESQVDLTKSRNVLIAAFILVLSSAYLSHRWAGCPAPHPHIERRSELGRNVTQGKTRAGATALSCGRYRSAAWGMHGEPRVRYGPGSRGNLCTGGNGPQAKGEHDSCNPRTLG